MQKSTGTGPNYTPWVIGLALLLGILGLWKWWSGDVDISPAPAGVGGTSSHAADIAAAKVERERAIFVAKETLETAKALEQAIKTWESEVTPLYTNELGRRLGTQEKYVMAFLRLTEEEQKRPQLAQVQAAKSRVDIVLKTLESAPKETTQNPAPLLSELTKERTWLDNGLQVYTRTLAEMKTMRADAERAGPGKETLREAIGALQNQTHRERMARDNARQTQRDKDIEDLKKQHEQKLHAQKVAAVKQEQEAELERERRRLEREALERDARDKNVQRVFAPFLDNGRYAGFELHNTTMTRTPYEVPQPWSYGDLSRLQAFNKFENFLDLATDPRDRMRTRWPRPQSEAEKTTYRQRWETFKKLAPLWKEEKHEESKGMKEPGVLRP